VSWVTQLARPDILTLKAYEHAPWEAGLTRLHANELPWRSACDDTLAGLNRYPEPQPRALLARLAGLYGAAPESLLVARGSDDAIDVLVRVFCRAGTDAVLVCPPTFGMYALAAGIQGARVVSVPLHAPGFALDVAAVLRACTPDVKIVFLCSPNNPTGNLLKAADIATIVRELAGRALIVVDEAYIEFAAA
jgi:histidinol-phosphate aminotransferase